MSFFKKIFGLSSNEPDENDAKKQQVHLSLDDAFVHHFIDKGGKFLYCETSEEVKKNLSQILLENNWTHLTCFDKKLNPFLEKSNVTLSSKLEKTIPVFISCEHLIADSGDILFSSNQLKSNKLAAMSENFIVYATTSQLVKNTGEGLTGIKNNCIKNIPTNISAIKNYTIKKDDDNFLNYGNTNSKNLYLLLFEDL